MDEPEERGPEALEMRHLRQAIKRQLFGGADEPLRLGRFIVLERLGEGGMGVVFSGFDPTLDRKVAIKVLRAESGDGGERQRLRTLREAQALAKLSHPNVINVFEVGELDGSIFIVMEFIRGTTLRAWLDAAPRSRTEVLGVLLHAGRGLVAAHHAGLVHRDFKPENVMVGEDGSVRVLDFGLAKLTGSASEETIEGSLGDEPSSPTEQSLTRTGVRVGTPAYMAPEQWAGMQPDARSDQYSFCAVLYEALYGARPNRGDTIATLFGERELSPATPTDRAVPAWLQTAVLRGLARAPDDRFASLESLLELLAHDPEEARRLRRRRGIQTLGTIAATAVLIVAAYYGSAALERFTAERQAETRRAALRGEVAELRARGEPAKAAALLRTFVELPDHRGTAAPARAYLDWAADEPDHAAAVDAYASAYIGARAPADEHAALAGLTRRLGARGAMAEATAALAVLERDAPAAAADPGLVDLRLDAALHRRDLGAASELLRTGADPDAWGPVLADLSRTTAVSRAHFGAPPGSWADMRAADIDGDGRAEISAAVLDWAGSTVRVLRADLALTPVHTLAVGTNRGHFPVPFAVSPEPLVLVDHLVDAPQRVQADIQAPDGGELRLQRLDGGDTAEPLIRWADSTQFAMVAADLDADGRTELYVGTGAYHRQLWRLDRADDGTWSRRLAYPAMNALDSDINAMVAADLDGDGRPELIVAIGPWTAYDLRVLRAGVDGQLELVARRSFGNLGSLVILRTEVGPVIAVIKNDNYPSSTRFPRDRPRGDPEGLYLVALRGRSLAVLDFFPDRQPLEFRHLFAGDLDGDGRDELIVGLHEQSLMLLRWRPGEPMRPLVVPGLSPALVLDVDGDARAEVLVVPPDEPENFRILGMGDQPITPAIRSAPAPRPVPRDLDDPAITAAWVRGEQLVAIGLFRRPADELAALARLAGRAAADLHLRTGELYAHLGDDARAAEQFVAAAVRPALAADALAGAAASRRRLGEFAVATALTRAQLQLPGLTQAAREAAVRELTALQQAIAARPELTLDFTRPLHPGWRIHDPLAAQRDPARLDLSLWSSTIEVAGELELVWDGGPAAIEVELEVDRLEYGVELTVGIAGAAANHSWIGVRAGGYDEVREPKLRLHTFDDHAQESEFKPVLIRAATAVRARVEVFPGLDTTITEIAVEGATIWRQVRPTVHKLDSALPDHGPVRLQLRSTVINPGLVGHMWIRRIHLKGFALAPVADADPTAPERLLAEDDLLATLAALPDPAAGSLAQLWRVEALARLGRVEAASAELRDFAELDADAPAYAALRHRLRRPRDALTLAARVGLGERYLDVVTQPMSQVIRTSDLVEALEGLEIATEPQTDPQRRLRQIAVLYLRGRALVHVGRFAAAATAYAEGLALLDDPTYPVPGSAEIRHMVRTAVVAMTVAAGDVPGTLRSIRALLAISGTPELELERLRADPGVAALLGPDAWSTLLAGE